MKKYIVYAMGQEVTVNIPDFSAKFSVVVMVAVVSPLMREGGFNNDTVICR